MTGRSIITPWSFRDGKDYIITFTVNGHPSSLSLKVADKITAEEWTCSYDDKSIESLTQRTGSFKSFEIFTSMLKSAILKKSDSVALDLMTIQDLQILLSQKKQTSSNYGQQTASTSTTSHFSYPEEDKSQGASSKKRFLIMTYVSEFDTVRYPIPLNYAGPPDPVILQNNIKRLQTEVSTLRNAKEALEEQVNHLKLAQQPPNQYLSEVSIPRSSSDPNEEVNPKANAVTTNFSSNHYRNQRLCQMNQDPNNNCLRNSNKNNNDKECIPEDELAEQRLMEHIKNLEEKFLGQKREHHQDKMKIAELEAENTFLRRKLEEFETQEADMHSEIQRLRKQVVSLQEAELNKRLSASRGRQPYGSRTFRNTRGIPKRNGRDNNNNYYEEYESDMDITGKRYKSCDKHGNRKHRPIRDLKTEISSKLVHNKRYNAASPSPVGNFHHHASSRSRSNSSTRQPKFDPTAYITEKRLKQEQIAKMRLERVNSRLSLRSNSSDARSRSNSIGSRSNRFHNPSRINKASSFPKSKDHSKRPEHLGKNDRIGIKSRQKGKPPTTKQPISQSSDSKLAELMSSSKSKTIHNAGDSIDDTQLSELLTSSILDPEISHTSNNKKLIPLNKKPPSSLTNGLRNSLNLSPSLTLKLKQIKQKQNKIGPLKKKKSMSPTERISMKKPGIRFTDAKVPIPISNLDPEVHLDPVTITALNCIFNPSSRQRTA